jgi:hypothetical protein
MSATSIPSQLVRKRPWHLWTVAILTLLWNGSGAVTIMLAQAGRLPDISLEEAAYYAAQPLWFVLVTEVALLAPLAAAVALLLLSRSAVWLFALSVAAVFATNAYDIAAGTSLVLSNTGALVVTCIVVVLAVLQWVYAYVMKQRGVLR